MKQRGRKKNELKEIRTISETSRTMLYALPFPPGLKSFC